jgi:uncharacterized cupin superfamily protein
MTKRINVETLPVITGTLYPPPFDEPCRARQRTRLADAAGLTQYGVNLVRLKPGAWSSQRHWHIAQDEFIYILSGEVTLVTNAGPEILRAGDCAGFKAGEEDGHHLQNNSSADVTFLEMGTRLPSDGAYYSDIDMMVPPSGKQQYCHRDGRPYPKQKRRGS